jgi:hypothetical protein
MITDHEEPGRSRLLFLCIVRLIVEKHGGHLDINEKNETFTVNIPEERKVACFRELREAVGPMQQVHETTVPIQ